MTRLDWEEVNKISEERSRINALDVRDVELYKDGKRIELTEEIIEAWSFTGLNFFDFYLWGFESEILYEQVAEKGQSCSVVPASEGILSPGIIPSQFAPAPTLSEDQG